MKSIIFRFYKSIIFALFIVVLSFLPSKTFNSIPTFTLEDKLAHLFLYFGLALLLQIDFRLHKVSQKARMILTCIIFPIVFGGLIEFLQPILSQTRSASLYDWLFNISGVFLAWAVFSIAYKKNKHKNKNKPEHNE